MLHSLGSKSQRSRSRWNKAYWKQHFLGLLTRCLENISLIFTKLTPMMYCEAEMNALNFGVKRSSSRSRWNNIFWNRHCTGGGIQYSTSRVELDFLVAIYSTVRVVLLCCRSEMAAVVRQHPSCARQDAAVWAERCVIDSTTRSRSSW